MKYGMEGLLPHEDILQYLGLSTVQVGTTAPICRVQVVRILCTRKILHVFTHSLMQCWMRFGRMKDCCILTIFRI